MSKNISLRKLIQKFRKLRFDGPYSGSRYLFITKGNLKVRILNPHKGDISQHFVAEILRQAGITSKEWNGI